VAEGRVSRTTIAALLGSILVLGTVLSVVDSRRDSAISDEPIHVAAGVVEARNLRFSVNVEHPPLAKHLFGLAAAVSGLRESPALSYRDFFRSCRDFALAAPPGGLPGDVLLAARGAAIALFVLLLLAAFWAPGGGTAGLLAAALLAGDTAFFPHGHLVATDVPLTLFAVLSCGVLVRLLERPAPARVAALALSLGGALATKHSAVLLVALAAAALAWTALRRRSLRWLLAAALVPLGALGVLDAYLHLFLAGDPAGTLDVLGRIYRMSETDMTLLRMMEGVDRGLARWAFGLLFILRQSAGGRLTYFIDGATAHPSAAYHLVALVVKSPAVWLAAVSAGTIRAARPDPPGRARLFLLAAGLLFLASLPGPRIGVRHVFPSVALATVGAATALAPIVVARAGARGVAAAVCLALLPLGFGRGIGSNGLIGSLAGRPLLADSNLDWGQDLLRLRDLLDRERLPLAEVSIAYVGGDRPSVRVPGILDLLEEDTAPRRYVAVSRQLLLVGPEAVLFREAVPRAARLLALVRRAQGPPRLVARAGDSIDVYDLTPPKAAPSVVHR